MRLWMLLLLALCGANLRAATCGYANASASGKYVDSLCFFDLSGYNDTTASSASGQNFSFTLPSGGTLSFNLKRTNGASTQGGVKNAPLTAAAIPTYSGAALGNGNWYAGVPGKPVMYQTVDGTTSVLTFTNFVLTNSNGQTLSNFDFIAIDGETTTAPTEYYTVQTNGSGWQLIDASGTNIQYTGMGTGTLTWRSPNGNAAAPIVRTHSPTQVIATIAGQGLQGMAFALAETTVVVQKNIVDPYGTGYGRAVPGDQFQLSIADSNGSQFDQRGLVATTGSAGGLQAERAQSLIYSTGNVTIAEAMAAGSLTALNVYSPKITCLSSSGATTGLPNNVAASSVTLTTLSPVSFDLIHCTITNTIPQPQVSVQKTVNANGPVAPGGTIRYTVSVTNTGQVTARNTVIQDNLPAGITAFSWTCLASGGAVCPHVSGTGSILETVSQPLTPGGLIFPPGGKLVYNIVATVDPRPPATILNTASAAPPGGNCFPDDSAPPCNATVSNTPGAVIAIGKTSSSSVAIGGGTVSYAITVRNTGSVDAPGTVVSDAIPTGLTTPYTWACSVTNGAICPNASGNGAINETIATLPAGGAVIYTVTATVAPNPPASIVNIANATPPAPGICDNGSVPPCSSQTTMPAAPVISISKTATPNGSLGAGDLVSYAITVTNTGNVTADGTLVHDDFPNGIDNLTGWICTSSGGAVCPNASSGPVASPAPMINETIATFPPGGSLTWTLSAVVNLTPDPPSSYITNTAVATPPNQGRCAPNYTPGPCAATVANPSIPVVQISKTAAQTLLAPGGAAVYTVTVRNVGTTDAAGTRITDPIPPGLTAPYTWSCAAGNGAVCPVASGSGALDQTLATFPADGEATYTITATVASNPPSVVTNTATAVPPPDGVCNSSRTTGCNAEVTLPVAPQISVVKTASTPLATAGQAITWGVTIANTGNTDASDTIFSDPLPNGIDPTAGLVWSCAASGGAVCPTASGNTLINALAIPALPPGGRVVFTLNGTVAATPPETIINTAIATPPNQGRCAPDNSLPPCLGAATIQTPPVISIAKQAQYVYAVPGTQVSYVVTVDNTSNTPANGTVVDDPIPNGLTAPFTWTCTAGGGAVCPNASGSGALHETIATFPAGGEMVYTVTATVTNLPPLIITNAATATPPANGLCADGHAVPCYASAPIVGVPSISIDKSVAANGPVVQGNTLTYTITVSNDSNSYATGTIVQDAFPAGIASAQISACSASGGAACPSFSTATVAPPAAMLDTTIPTFPPGGSVTFTIIATIGASPPAPIVNTAIATPPLNGLCLPDNTSPPCTATVTTTPEPIIAIHKSANQTVLVPGTSVTYTVTAKNTGNAPADGTAINDPVASGLTSYNWTCSASGGAVCPATSGSGAVDATIATFPSGGQVVFAITAAIAANPPASVANTATVTPPSDGICDGSCNSTVTVPSAPQIGIAKSAAQTQTAPNQPVNWTVTITNTGNADATGTSFSDPLPDGIVTSSATWTCTASDGAICPHASGNGAIVNETINVFPPGARLVYQLYGTASATPPMLIANTAQATPPPHGLCAPTNSPPPCTATATTPTAPNLSIEKSVIDLNGDGIAQRGERLVYNIVLRNSGGTALNDFSITDELDSNTSFVSARPSATNDAGTLTWTGLALPAGGTLTLIVIANVNASVPVGATQIANLAYQTGDPAPDCNTVPTPPNCALIPLPTAAKIAIAKRIASVDYRASGIIGYTVIVSNIGTIAATNVRIYDPVPAGIAAMSWNCAPSAATTCPHDSGNGAIAEVAPSLPSGAQLSYTLIATIGPMLPTQIVNTATTQLDEGICAPCQASVTTGEATPPDNPIATPTLDARMLFMLAWLIVLATCLKLRTCSTPPEPTRDANAQNAKPHATANNKPRRRRGGRDARKA